MASVPQLCFQVLDLPSEGMEVEETVSFAALGIEGDELLSFPSDLHVAFNVAPVGEGVLVRGRAWAAVARCCDRCLEPHVLHLDVPDLCYHFEEVAGNLLDLTEDVREDILLALPQHYLCREDCAGLCPHCGQDLNRGSCSCEQETDEEDPWHALDGLDIETDD